MMQPTPEKPATTKIRRAIPSRIAATIREEDEVLAATIDTAKAIAQAAVAEANRRVERGRARHAAAMRTILRALKIDEGTFTAIDGFGTDTSVEIEIPQQGARNA